MVIFLGTETQMQYKYGLDVMIKLLQLEVCIYASALRSKK